MTSDWLKDSRTVKPSKAGDRLALLCVEEGYADGCYTQAFDALGFETVHAPLFSFEHYDVPAPIEKLGQSILIAVPSVRALEALTKQEWFDRLFKNLTILTPGEETTAAAMSLGLKIGWTAVGGFRQSKPPASLLGQTVYLVQDPHLQGKDQFEFQGLKTLYLPLYSMKPNTAPVWTTYTARRIAKGKLSAVLILSLRQRYSIESKLKMMPLTLGTRPNLIGLSERMTKGASPILWGKVSFPAVSSRESLLEHLNSLAFI